MQDRFLQQIKEALNGTLNPTTFEACACELIRMDIPGVVPIPGGSDSGMDGAIPDLEGEAYPLVCTTGDDVIGNLTNSIDSYVRNKGPRRNVVVATSQSLTPQRQNKLKERAREKGFNLVNIYERQAIAERLYRNPRWCKNLLGLTGEPSILSKIPPNPRFDLGNTLVGRSEDLEWLKKCQVDSVLVGQPGAGKTHLLKQFVSDEQNAYFLTGSNRAEIAGAIRECSPQWIIVDDAHTLQERLDELLTIRREVGATFSIIAIAWPHDLDNLQMKLSASKQNCRELRLLRRAEIVEVIKTCEIAGPDELIREIVNQSEGKPGLTVLLSSLCLRGDIKEFLNGDLLVKWVFAALSQNVGEKPKEILASFALAGAAGLSLTSVANALSLSAVNVRRTVETLAAAGVITEVRDALVVTPATLRWALVRDVFFSGPKSLDSKIFHAFIENKEQLALTMLGAVHRGANIPEDQLLDSIAMSGSGEAWESFGWLGEWQTVRVLSDFPDHAEDVVSPALELCPDKILPLMLEWAISDNRPLNSHPDHSMRKLQEWIEGARPGQPTVTRRRKTLLQSLITWLDANKNASVAFQALPYVFSLRYSENSSDPGDGMTIRINSGVISKEDISQLTPLWEKALQLLNRHPGLIQWKAIFAIIDGVAGSRFYARNPPQDYVDAANSLAEKMLRDVCPLAKGHSGVSSRLLSVAEKLGVEVDLSVDPLYELFFPSREEYRLFHKNDEAFNEIRKLAKEWASRTPNEVTSDITRLEMEAKKSENQYPKLTSQFCYFLAEEVAEPLKWCEAFFNADLSNDLLMPFFRRAVTLKSEGWEEFASRTFSSALRSNLIEFMLLLPQPPEHLLETALKECKVGYGESIEHLIGRCPDSTYERLLKHPEVSIAGHAAVGEWNASKFDKRPMRSKMSELWKNAIINLDEEEYWLNEILKSDNDLAFRWILKCFERGQVKYQHAKLIAALCPHLSVEQRRQMLNKLPNSYFGRELVLDLVQEDLGLSEEVFKSDAMKSYHLDLVEWRAGVAWEGRIIQASDAGYSLEKIVSNVFPNNYSWSGDMSNYFKDWVEKLNYTTGHSDERIRKVGALALASVEKRLEDELKQEEKERIYGRYR